LLGDLEEAERKHQMTAEALQENIPLDAQKSKEDAQRRLFVLQIIQPGLAGLMDGSVSTPCSSFRAASPLEAARMHSWLGLAASIGAGISMAFAEALSDDGSLTGAGRPVLRGALPTHDAAGESVTRCHFCFLTSTLLSSRQSLSWPWN